MEQYQISTADGATSQAGQVTLLHALPQQVVTSGGQMQGQVQPQILQLNQSGQIVSDQPGGHQNILQQLTQPAGQQMFQVQTVQVPGQSGQLQQIIIQQPQQPQQVVQTQDGQTIIYQPLQAVATTPTTTGGGQTADNGASLAAQGQQQQQQTIQIQSPSALIHLPLSTVQSSPGALPTGTAMPVPTTNSGTTANNGGIVMMMTTPGGVPTLQRMQVPEQDILDDQPLYVNAKQYHRILKRRQARAKLEAQGKIPKQRQKYLHESRHRHAMNRTRGDGGRFYTSEEVAAQAAEAALAEQLMKDSMGGMPRGGAGSLLDPSMFKTEKNIAQTNGQMMSNLPVISSSADGQTIIMQTAEGTKLVSICANIKGDSGT